ncbi:type IV pilus twitching motility protein PilT [Synoicihabitans lomoniglobus]|uniref:PilT/PilU family type 4a pilus ATPase n=1 Tax=Synoicihabitans lomoniglobus TaxID=2909285 RepID=A0AAF0A196_9BACT|nr:PilT/PilU family type 4a pilus ATPase [Opitutaceae bacterium LMO-M01]WED64837.1 PilT/PilU family type 4a pilus ATPase [Opitutaceae bacterium LMO-M01]
MVPAISWLARFGIDQGLFTLEQAKAVQAKLGDDAELIDFAQELIDEGHVADAYLADLEALAGKAFQKGSGGPPENDPFGPPGRDKPKLTVAADTAPVPAIAPEPEPVPAIAPEPAPAVAPPPPTVPASAPAPKAEPAPVAAAPGSARMATSLPPADAVVEAGELDFDNLAALSDEALAAQVRGMLVLCGEEGVSDLHISAGATPFVRRQLELTPISEHIITEAEALRINTALLAPSQRAIYMEQRDYDFALALDAVHRYRVNLMFHKNGSAGCYRTVIADVPEIDKLGLKNVDTIKKMLSYHNGLMLVTGPVGAGKTTTLAALVHELNKQRKDHIITVEDPVEIVQESIGCNITQRQVGTHTKSFHSALKGALREDPDIIVIGELRDLETIEMAISASETGHLVIGTMHTSDASTTLNRLLDVFPPAQQTQIRSSVAESLRGVICQRLLPATEGGLILATEMLVSNRAVAALIKEGKMQGLRNVMETGVREGMCVMENSVMELYRARKVSAETARQNVTTRQLLAQIK